MSVEASEVSAISGEWPKHILWVAILWLIGWLGICADQAVSYTNPLEGLASGAIQGIFVSPFLLIYLIPAGLIGRAIGSVRCLRPYRWWISLILPLGLTVAPVVLGIMDRVEPGRRFERFTKISLPENPKDLKVSFSGGFLPDYRDTYTFECPRDETDEFIHRLGLKKAGDNRTHVMGMPGGDFSPEQQGWKNPERWESPARLGTTDYFELFTDESHTRVHVVYGTI